MGVSGQFAKYSREESKFDRSLWAKRALVVALCVAAVLAFDLIRSRRAASSAALPAEYETERIVGCNSQLLIGNDLDDGASNLTLIDTFRVTTAGTWLKNGFHRYLPASTQTGAGGNVALPSPEVTSVLMNDQPFSQFSVRELTGWRGIRIGADGWEMPKGESTFQIVSRIPSVPLFASSGGGMIELPLIAPSLLQKDRVDASVVFPAYANKESVKFTAWIGAVNEKAELLPLHEAVDGELVSEEISPGRPPQLVARFSAPKRLGVFQGLWVRVAW